MLAMADVTSVGAATVARPTPLLREEAAARAAAPTKFSDPPTIITFPKVPLLESIRLIGKILPTESESNKYVLMPQS